jgi:hypothetical protein
MVLRYRRNVSAMAERYRMRSYLLGVLLARTGEEMSGPALLLAGLAITGSATTASLLLAGVTVTTSAGGPLAGALLDRSLRPGRLLAGALAAYASGLAIVVVSLGRVPVAVTLSVAACAGFAGPALSGGWTSQLPRVVSAARLPRASALDVMTFDAASLAGPALAGAAAGAIGAPYAVAGAVVMIAAAAPAAWLLPPAPGRPDVPRSAGVAAGFRAVFEVPALARATVTSVVSCAGQGLFVACCPVLAARAFGAAGGAGPLLSGVALVALAANALLSRRRARPPDALLWTGALGLGIASLLAATARPVPLAVAAVFAGAGEGPQLTALFAVRHREAPYGLRGQVFTTGASLKITGFAAGAAAAGPLAAWSPHAALVTAAGVQVLAALAYAALTPATSATPHARRRGARRAARSAGR